ncbi:MAG TPA: dihydropteroate synthase [Candidatus Binatia bacterium]|nr:dihydropteroate synthase [Candidatus Binatia bacterium]
MNSTRDLTKGADRQPGQVLTTRHGRIDMTCHTVVMGIVNVTPDSFYDGGKRFDTGRAADDAVEMIDFGAEILDIGGESTRPGAQPVTLDEELRRVLPVIRELRKRCSVPISVDTYKEAVARAALDEGADIVNDISALRFDPAMAALVANEGVPLILMHMQGVPRTMQREPHYQDVLREVRDFLAERVRAAKQAGIAQEEIIIDPGIGFGKTLAHNLVLLKNLQSLNSLGQPLLIGVSRKAFIGKILNAAGPEERLEGSVAAAVSAALNGANILRVHDVSETVRALRVIDAIRLGRLPDSGGR